MNLGAPLPRTLVRHAVGARLAQTPRPREPTMAQPQLSNSSATALVAVKVVHTIAWAVFVGCILAIPVASWYARHTWVAWLVAIVLVEGAVLLANGWRCPLTSLAARFTDERHDNFDIYLPAWLAKHNKTIFSVLFAAGATFALGNWAFTGK